MAEGTEANSFVEHYELHPIDRQTNGPQLFYGLRYHTHITKPGEFETFHDQVGYWLYEPAAETVTLTLAIPGPRCSWRRAPQDRATRNSSSPPSVGSEVYGILSNPFLDQSFRTVSYRIHVTVNGDGTWSYEEEGMPEIPGRDELFSHVDRNTLTKVGPAELNPLAVAARNVGPAIDDVGSLGIGSLRAGESL